MYVREQLSKVLFSVSTLSARNAWHYDPYLETKKQNGLQFLTRAFPGKLEEREN